MEVSYDHYPWFFGSFLFCLIFYYFISPIISPKLADGYVSLTEDKKIMWHTVTISNVHVVVACTVAIYALLTDEAIYQDVAWGKSFLAQLPLAITLGYIVADTVVMLHKFKLKEARSYLAHHFSTALPYWANITFGPLTFFAVIRLLAEFSTPFVNQRYFFDVLGKKASKGYVVNGVLLTIVFFLTRIVVIPPYYHRVYYVLANNSTEHHLHWAWLLIWVGGSIILDILNVWWFRKILRGAIKAIQAHKPAKEENGDTVRNRVKGE